MACSASSASGRVFFILFILLLFPFLFLCLTTSPGNPSLCQGGERERKMLLKPMSTTHDLPITPLSWHRVSTHVASCKDGKIKLKFLIDRCTNRLANQLIGINFLHLQYWQSAISFMRNRFSLPILSNSAKVWMLASDTNQWKINWNC